MKPLRILLPLLAASLAGCATTGSESTAQHPVDGTEDPATQEAPPPEEPGPDLAQLDAKLHVAESRQALAKMEMEALAEDLGNRMGLASTELELARGRLATFVEASAPQRLASERLSFKSAQDRAREAAEELAQIEIMYEDQDLDDLTAEFVVSRGRRSAERAAARLEIQEAELRTLEERELPAERQVLLLAVSKNEASLAKAKNDGELSRKRQMIAIMEADNAIQKLRDELEKAREKAEQ